MASVSATLFFFHRILQHKKAFISNTVSTVTVLFKNTPIMKFKNQLMLVFFTAINHVSGRLRKLKLTLTCLKGHGLWFVIGEFQSILYISVFQGSLLVIVIMIDSSEKCNIVKVAFDLQSLHGFEKGSKMLLSQALFFLAFLSFKPNLTILLCANTLIDSQSDNSTPLKSLQCCLRDRKK